MNFTRILSTISKQLTASPATPSATPIVRTLCSKKTVSAPINLFRKPTKVYEKAVQQCREAGDLMKNLTASLEKQFESKALDYSRQWSRYLYSSAAGKKEDAPEADNLKPKNVRSYECKRKLAGWRTSGSGGNDSNRCGKSKAKCKPSCPKAKSKNPCPVIEDECARCPPKPKCVKKCEPASPPPKKKKLCGDPGEVCPKPKPRCPQPDKTCQPKCPKPGQKQSKTCPQRPKDCARKCPPVESKKCGSGGKKSGSKKSSCGDDKPSCASLRVCCPKPKPKCTKKPEKTKKCSPKKQKTTCGKKVHPCANKKDSCGKKEDTCAKKEDTCAKKAAPCAKENPCGKKKQQKCQPCPREEACKKTSCGGCGKKSGSGDGKCKKFEKLEEECDPQGEKADACGSAATCKRSQSESESCRDEEHDECREEEKPKEIPDIFKQLKNILDTTNKSQLETQFGEYYKNKEYFMYKTHSFYDVMRHLKDKRLPLPSPLGPPKKSDSSCDPSETGQDKKSRRSSGELRKKESKCSVSKSGISPCQSRPKKKSAQKTTWSPRKNKRTSPKKKATCGCGKCGTSIGSSAECGSRKGGSAKCGSSKGGSGKCGSPKGGSGRSRGSRKSGSS